MSQKKEILFEGEEFLDLCDPKNRAFYHECLNERMNLRLQQLYQEHGPIRVLERETKQRGDKIYSYMKVVRYEAFQK